MDISLLSPCNIYCGNRVLHRKNKCLGCARESEKRKNEEKRQELKVDVSVGASFKFWLAYLVVQIIIFKEPIP